MAQSDRNLRHFFPPGVAGEARCSGIAGVKTVTRVREMSTHSVVTCASLSVCFYPLVLRQGLGVGPIRGQGWAGLGWGSYFGENLVSRTSSKADRPGS